MSAHQLLSKLLDYVLEQAKDIDPRGFNLAGHKGFKRARPDLQGLPGVDFDIKIEGDHIWLRVARLEAFQPPALSEEKLRELITIDAEPTGQPPRINEITLKHRLSAGSAGRTPDELTVDENQIRSALHRALAEYTPLWTAWAEGEKPRRRTIGLYADLFAIKHQLEAEETAKPHELVWGIGVSGWKINYEERAGRSVVEFQYPLLTQAVEVSLDERTLAIELRPRSVDPRFEFDAFAACQLSSTAEVEKAAKESLAKSADRPISPFDVGSFEHILKLVAGNLHEQGRYVSGATGFPGAADALVVSDAWVVLSRPRSNNYLHEDIARLKARLGDGGPIPLGPLALVTPPSDELTNYEPVSFRGLSGGSGSGSNGQVQELFFPLPYNHEQITIVEQLERSSGVAVQGPPGTGKTHTIANIVCHYLATGRKVLVTAKGEQALEVLQSKIPEEVQPLTVAVAEMLKLPAERVHCMHMEGAGCYGHNAADDAAADAALIARAWPGRPVRVQWMREEEHAWEPFGPAMLTKARATLDASGRISSWQYDVWSNTHSTRPGKAGNLAAAWLLENPFTPPPPVPLPQPEGGGDRNAIAIYTLPNARVVHHFIPEMPLRVSALRSLGAYMNVFSIESFMDELARAARVDPVEFRLRHLDDARAREVVEMAAERFGWTDTTRQPGHGRGFAFARYKNLAAYCAIAMDVEVERETGDVRIGRIVSVVDSGEAVNPDGIRNQIEGGILQSASWTMFESVTWEAARITSRDWGRYPVLRFAHVPRSVEVHVIDRPGQPFLGTGEAAQGPASAALANAIADATGARIREIPLDRARVKAAIDVGMVNSTSE